MYAESLHWVGLHCTTPPGHQTWDPWTCPCPCRCPRSPNISPAPCNTWLPSLEPCSNLFTWVPPHHPPHSTDIWWPPNHVWLASGRYTPYWSAFLFDMVSVRGPAFEPIILKSVHILQSIAVMLPKFDRNKFLGFSWDPGKTTFFNKKLKKKYSRSW